MREAAAIPASNSRPREVNARDLIERRIANLTEWLNENCPNCGDEQRHLDEGTVERQYWHYGYLVALRDIRKLLGLDEKPLN